MKKVILLLLFCPVCIFAQHNDSYPYTLGVFASPQLYGISVFNSFHNSWAEPQVGFSAGLNGGVKIADKITLRGGLGYSLVRYRYISELRLGTDVTAGTTSEYVQSLKYHEVHLPLIIQYGNKFFGTFGTEASYQFGRENTKRVIYAGNGDVDELQRMQPEGLVNLALQLGMGFTIPIKEQQELLLEPVFKYYLMPYVIQNSYLHSLGLKATLNFGL